MKIWVKNVDVMRSNDVWRLIKELRFEVIREAEHITPELFEGATAQYNHAILLPKISWRTNRSRLQWLLLFFKFLPRARSVDEKHFMRFQSEYVRFEISLA